MERELLVNRWRTPDGTVLQSFFTHDYVAHDDANGESYFVDGGSEYCRISLNNEKMTDMCVYDDSPFSLIRNTVRRGTFDSEGNRIWIPVCNMSSPHLENCIVYMMKRYAKNKHLFVYIRELLLRWEANIYVPEKEYTAEDAVEGTGDAPEIVRSCEDTLATNIDETLDELVNRLDGGEHADSEEIAVLMKHVLGLRYWKESLRKHINA